jgi:hypothetical protein
MENKNYFQGNSQHPQHISVGAVVLNDKSEVCCHHFDTTKGEFKGYWKDQGLQDFYILMRETIEPNETLEQALHCGLMEEFGIEAELIDYIGSIQSHFESKGITIEKTTLYFLCKLKNQDLTKRSSGDVEYESQVEWQTADFLIPRMKEQARIYGRTDVDESPILEKIKNVYISLEVTTGRRIIDFEKYINLSPVEKIRLLISQKNMIYMEQCALDRRRKSLKLDEYEMLFLNYRINFLSKCALIIHDCIIFTFYKYFKRGSPRVKEFYEEILSSGNYIGGNNKFRGKEYCRYPYDFKRPDNVPPNQWGSPNYDWNTDDHINKTKESNSSRRVKE